MDIDFPFAEDKSRQQLLYRLPTAPAPRRLLLVGNDPDGIARGWDGPVTTVAVVDLADAASPDGADFDAVALPGLTDMVAAGGTGALRLLADARRRLVPGGLVIGHLEHALTLRRLARPRQVAAILASLVGGGLIGSAAGCRKALLQSGFVEPECYYVVPSFDAPMGLIPCHPVAARAWFLRAVRAAEGHFSAPAYASRLLLAFMGLGGHQQGQLFFWARKTC